MSGGHAMYGPVPSDLYGDGLHGPIFSGPGGVLRRRVDHRLHKAMLLSTV